jgi:hypothetical protein
VTAILLVTISLRHFFLGHRVTATKANPQSVRLKRMGTLTTKYGYIKCHVTIHTKRCICLMLYSTDHTPNVIKDCLMRYRMVAAEETIHAKRCI